MNSIKICLFLFSCILFAAACSETPNTNTPKNTATVSTPGPVKPAAVDELAMAKEIYATNCMICHKESGKGGKVTIEGKSINPENLTAEKMKKMSDEKLIGYITNGVEDEGMPAFKGKLTDEQIKSVVKHVRILQN